MKKIIPFILFIALLVCLVGCSLNGNEGNGGGNNDDITPSPDGKSVYEMLNSFVGMAYEQIGLEIKTETDGIELNAEYVLTQSKVIYAVEKVNTFSDDIASDSPEFITTISGEAIVVNGEITAFEGEAVELPDYDKLKAAFTFSADNFTKVSFDEDSFSGEVISIKGFLGSNNELDASNMNVNIEFSNQALKTLILSYNTTESIVTAVYTFN